MQALEKPPERLPPCPTCGEPVEQANFTFHVEAFNKREGSYDFDVPQHGEPEALLAPCEHEVDSSVDGYRFEAFENAWQELFKEALRTLLERWQE